MFNKFLISKILRFGLVDNVKIGNIGGNDYFYNGDCIINYNRIGCSYDDRKKLIKIDISLTKYFDGEFLYLFEFDDQLCYYYLNECDLKYMMEGLKISNIALIKRCKLNLV